VNVSKTNFIPVAFWWWKDIWKQPSRKRSDGLTKMSLAIWGRVRKATILDLNIKKIGIHKAQNKNQY